MSDEPPPPSPKRSLSWFRGILACLVVLGLGAAFLFWAWSQQPQAIAPPGEAEVSTVSADQGTLSGDHFDHPERDGWKTEAFSNQASAQLKTLAKRIVQDDLQPQQLSDLLAADFQCTPLRPDPLKEVFADQGIRVLRPDSLPTKTSDSQSTELVEALNGLLAPFGKRSGLRLAFKIVGVNLRSAGASTTVRTEVFGELPSGSVQQVATWRCQWTEPNATSKTSPKLKSIQLKAFEEVQVSRPSRTLYADCTEAVLGKNSSYREQLKPGANDWLNWLDATLTHETFGFHGLALGDVNGDGLEDIYLCQMGGLPNRLFLQNADGTVTENSQAAGVDWLDPSHAALLLDLDNDGDQDLVFSTDVGLIFLENDGTGHFSQRFFAKGDLAYTLAAADYDGDGDIDLYTCVYYGEGRRPGQLATPVPYHDATNGGSNILWRNDIQENNWQFTDVTAEVGLDFQNTRWSLAAAWEDYDNDGDPDLYLANDFGRNSLYRNFEGRFVDVASLTTAEDNAFGMSVAWGDYNRDGYFDVYISNMFSAAGNRVTRQRQFKKNEDSRLRGRLQYLARGNSLLENTAGKGFRDESLPSGTTMGRWAWSSQFVDVNNDGWEDLPVANGYLTNELPHDL